MSEPLLLGIDLGTSYFKVGLFDYVGELKGLGRVAVAKSEPAPGRSELDCSDFWRLLRSGLEQALRQASASAGQIVSMSYSSQASTFVLLDVHDVPLTPLVFWNDSRGDPIDKKDAAFARSEIFRSTVGFEGLSGQFAVTKWRWFARNQPEIWGRTRRIMTISDYLTFALTGERAGDASTVGFLGLYDLAKRRWWPEALDVFGIREEKLSSPLAPGSRCGNTRPKAFDLLGMHAGVPFAVGGLDHHIAALGSGLGQTVRVSISTGTVLAALTLVEQLEPQADCYHGLHTDGRAYFRLSFDSRGAGQLEEYQRCFAADQSIEQLLALAETAYADGARPSDPLDARNHGDHGRAVLSILLSTATTHRRLVTLISGRTACNGILSTGGGSRSPLWLQVQADMLGVPVFAASSPERACLGAALLGAVAARQYSTMTEASSAMVRLGRRFSPRQ